MNRLVIDTGTLKSALLLVSDEHGILGGSMVENESIWAAMSHHLCDVADGNYLQVGALIERTENPIQQVIVEMITSFGGKHKSAHIMESALVIGRIQAYSERMALDFKRVSRQQIVSHFLGGKRTHADKKIRDAMKERLSWPKGKVHPKLKYDLWQAYAIYEYCRDHNFERWYNPKLDMPKIKLTPEERAIKQRRYLMHQVRAGERAQAALTKIAI